MSPFEQTFYVPFFWMVITLLSLEGKPDKNAAGLGGLPVFGPTPTPQAEAPEVQKVQLAGEEQRRVQVLKAFWRAHFLQSPA